MIKRLDESHRPTFSLFKLISKLATFFFAKSTCLLSARFALPCIPGSLLFLFSSSSFSYSLPKEIGNFVRRKDPNKMQHRNTFMFRINYTQYFI